MKVVKYLSILVIGVAIGLLSAHCPVLKAKFCPSIGKCCVTDKCCTADKCPCNDPVCCCKK